jgi:hypothetical protein
MTSNNQKTITKQETMQLLNSCKRTSLRCRETGATEVGWELPIEPRYPEGSRYSHLDFNDRYVASGWFDGETSEIFSQSGADKLGVSFSFSGDDADELKYCAASRVSTTLQPSEAEQERASLARLAKAADENGWWYSPATGGGLIIVPARD